jgi:hypothetical protein
MERLKAQIGQTLTQASIRARTHITQPLVVALRTVLPAVTDIVRRQTHAGAPTTVETFFFSKHTNYYMNKE